MLTYLQSHAHKKSLWEVPLLFSQNLRTRTIGRKRYPKEIHRPVPVVNLTFHLSTFRVLSNAKLSTRARRVRDNFRDMAFRDFPSVLSVFCPFTYVPCAILKLFLSIIRTSAACRLSCSFTTSMEAQSHLAKPMLGAFEYSMLI